MSFRKCSSISPWRMKNHNKEWGMASFVHQVRKGGWKAIKRLFLLMFFVISPLWSHAGSGIVPFEPGERLTYRLKWNNVIIGEVTVDVLSDQVVSGVNARHFYMTGRTSPFADTFYEYRVKAEGYVLPDMSRSVFYTSDDNYRKTRELVTIHFDQVENKAHYISEKVKKGKRTMRKKTVSILSDTFDMVSVFYHLRHQVKILGEKKEFPVSATNGRKLLAGKVYVVGDETIEVRDHGPRAAIHLQFDGKKLRDIHTLREKEDIVDLWISKDDPCAPLLIKGRAKFGRVAAELVTIGANDLTRSPKMD